MRAQPTSPKSRPATVRGWTTASARAMSFWVSHGRFFGRFADRFCPLRRLFEKTCPYVDVGRVPYDWWDGAKASSLHHRAARPYVICSCCRLLVHCWHSADRAAAIEWVAERVGFEPTVRLRAHTISSRARSATPAPLRGGQMAERVGFEPTRLAPTAFRERHLQPLGHLSVRRSITMASRERVSAVGCLFEAALLLGLRFA